MNNPSKSPKKTPLPPSQSKCWNWQLLGLSTYFKPVKGTPTWSTPSHNLFFKNRPQLVRVTLRTLELRAKFLIGWCKTPYETPGEFRGFSNLFPISGKTWKWPISFLCRHTIQRFQPMFLFSIFSCCIKSCHQPQEDLARSGYKTNQVLGILLYVDEPLKPIN
jgi:hypothetical protein